MKTLTKNNVSIYKLEDSKPIFIDDSQVTIGYPPTIILADCSSANCKLYEGVTFPEDWASYKYTFDGTTWANNPDYVASPPL